MKPRRADRYSPKRGEDLAHGRSREQRMCCRSTASHPQMAGLGDAFELLQWSVNSRVDLRTESGRKRLSGGRRIAVIDDPYYRRHGRLLDLGLFRYLERVVD
jgi:hypothetical protein